MAADLVVAMRPVEAVRATWRASYVLERAAQDRRPRPERPRAPGQSFVVVARDGREFAEEPVRLVVGPSREQQRLRRADHAVAELQRPQPIDRDPGAVLVAQGAEELAARGSVRIDAPVAEVADQQRAARASEALRRERDSPRR